MKNTIDCKVVRLPFVEGSILQLTSDKRILAHDRRSPPPHTFIDPWKQQHLYFTSDEPIKEGDWLIPTDTKDGKIVGYHKPEKAKCDYGASIYTLKCVASTDSSLGLPTIQEEFLKKYVAAQGKIDSVKLETTKIDRPGTMPFDHPQISVLKLTDNNEVVITDDDKVKPYILPEDKELEDAAKRRVTEVWIKVDAADMHTGKLTIKDFKAGANWQKERSTISTVVENFLSKFCTRVRPDEDAAYVELMMDDHDCVVWKNDEWYIPENNSFYTEEDELLRSFLTK